MKIMRSLSTDENALQYIDYSVHERLMDMTSSRDFWQSQLQGYNLEHSLPLPIDRHGVSTDQRSKFGICKLKSLLMMRYRCHF